MIWITRGLIKSYIFWNQIILATFHDQTRPNQNTDQTRRDQTRQEMLSKETDWSLVWRHIILSTWFADLSRPIWTYSGSSYCAIICERCGRALITQVDTSLSLTTPVFSNLHVFCVICQKMALVTFSPQHVAFESKLVTPRGQHWGQPGTSSYYHHHHIIMLKLSSHHHFKIIITIMIIIMSSRQKASRATISNSMFVMLAPIYPNHKEISWNATDSG